MAQWFRSWQGAPTDTKWLAVARRASVAPVIVSAIAWALLDYASQHDVRGSIAGFDTEGYAAWAGIEESIVTAVIAAMTEKGVIADEQWVAWDKRQPKREDSSTERVRAHRQRVTQRDTPSNEGGSATKHDVTHGNAPEKKRVDTETEADTEADETTTRAGAREVVVDTPFTVYAAFVEETTQPDFEPAPAWKSKQMGVAKRLLEQGFDADKVRRCVRYMRSQDWRTAPFDLFTVEKFIGTWEASGMPVRDEPRGSPASQRRKGQPDFSGIAEFERLMDQHEGKAP